MQIVENQFNPQCSVLYVSTNSHLLFSRHFFVRHTVLPSYISGFHPYLNQAALIYNSDGYWTILDYGMDIELLKN